jgi:hypothetical protein
MKIKHENKTIVFFSLRLVALSLLLSSCEGVSSGGKADFYTRGTGVYPGDPAEDYSPELVADNQTYRNVAKLRKAYHSSSYDYNLTAQLVTDGINSSEMPATISVSTQAGNLKKNEREWLFDGKSDSKYVIAGSDIFLQLDLNNISLPVSRFVLSGYVSIDASKPKGYEVIVYGSKDGSQWEVLKQEKGMDYVGIEMPPYRFSGLPPASGTIAPESEAPASPVIFNYDYTPPVAAPTMNPSGFDGGSRPTTRYIKQETVLQASTDYAYYRVAYKMPGAIEWTFTDWDYYNDREVLDILPSFFFHSAWQSAGAGEEWVYVDFGSPATVDNIKLHWINKAVSGTVQVSDDAHTWTNIAPLPGGEGLTDEIALDKAVKTQYVRLLLTEAANNSPYILSEFEVFGKGGLVPRRHKAPAATGNSLYLSGGDWKVQRASEVSASGEELAQPEYDATAWVTATVPGTVLSSYINAGAIPDPNYADNQLQVSESFFLSNFWYRNKFTLPSDFSNDNIYLHFDGINWKANVYLNGQKIGRMESGFIRGRFNVSDVVLAGDNVIVVEIIRNAHPGAVKEQTAYSTDQNGGIPGADNPTFHATVGWDWIPTIRGRDIGIWNDVYLTHTGDVTIIDPFVRTELPLPDTTSANVLVEVTLANMSDKEVSGTLKGSYGDAAFEQSVTLAAVETKVIHLDPSTHPSLKLKNPVLWWPKGYGTPHLYDVKLRFETGGKVSDQTTFKSGVRQMTFDESPYTPNSPSLGFGGKNKRLSLYINGRRFIGFGGNWGFGESNLNYRGREYDIAVAYHADMNFSMIRNWVGQIGDEEFYEACDRHGVMVWQDFWLANPVDGPDPSCPELFNTTAKDYIKRIRNHPSIGIYVGRNEGNPPPEIDNYLREVIPQVHPGIHYISNSAAGVVSGGGPYRALPPKSYFNLYGHDLFHSERGMPNVMNYESLVQTFGASGVNPVNTLKTPNSLYGLHDYTLGGALGASAQAANSFNEIIEKAFGQPKDARQFAEWAQWINYEGYRAIFEGRSEHRRGMLLWMSHPAWPSMVWQTYDYYFEPTGAYFGCKKAAEPLHIQWNPVRDDIEVINYHAFDQRGLTAKAQLVNQDGSVQWEKVATLDIQEDATVALFPLEFPKSLSATFFIKLALTKDGKIVSDNFYWKGKEDGDYKSLLQLPKVNLKATSTTSKSGANWKLTTILKNETATPALMIRLKAVGEKSRERILPVFFSDNYFFLLPGEEKEVVITLKDADTKGQKPVIEVSGFNL